MGKNLERFVRDNRAEFDGDRPSDALWSKIEQALPVNQSTPVIPVRSKKWKWISVAAAAILIVSAGALYINLTKDSPIDVPVSKTVVTQPVHADADIASIDPDYARQVAQFSTIIDEKQGELKSLQKDNPSLYEQFSNDISKLDSTYSLLKRQLPENPNKEELLQAMIYNLQLQIDLLNQQLDIIQKIKTAKSKSL